MLWRRTWAVIVAATLAACSQPRRAENKEAPRVVAVADAAPARLTDGVLAERPGIQGPIRVEQRDGRRLLIIADTVHAAVPWSATGPDPAARDPLVELLRLLRPGAETALVIGLGSGRTATELAQGGLVIELARAPLRLPRRSDRRRRAGLPACAFDDVRPRPHGRIRGHASTAEPDRARGAGPAA